MKRGLWVAVAVIALLGVAGWVAGRARVPVAPGSMGEPASWHGAHSGQGGLAQGPAATDVFDPHDLASLRRRAERFLLSASGMQADDRAREAARIASDVVRYEASGDMAATEAVILRLGLIQVDGADEATQADRIADVIASHRLRDTSGTGSLDRTGRDAAWARYQAREREITAEVMRMAQLPDGLTREEYLRQRLLKERLSTAMDTTP
ncbi:hypothetical protein [Tahibacter amnicola]|uniref:Lipase chaperone n=1 Tax=Tahibacter amnicola TaxID=2976241 RepID=A0ABY6BEW7_9GAMM|nr:hypothetical protein [Tahibacter amnicola]UXI68289.1 hypothetical protein N4264_01175 [Tahibacter amnicola]